MSVSISGDGSLSGIDQGLNVVGVVTATTISVGSGTSVSSPATNVLALGTNNSERVRINSSGAVGLGTANPQERLHNSITANNQNYLRLDNPSGTSYYGLNSSGDTEINAATNNNLIFKTFGTERFRIESGGNVKLSTAGTKVLNSSGNTILNQTGSVLQVVTTNKTDVFSTTSASMTDVTGLSATITPSSTSSKILVHFSVNMGNNAQYNLAAGDITRNGTPIALGDAAGSRQRCTFGTQEGGGIHGDMRCYAGSYLDSPSSTSTLTYQIRVRSEGGNTVWVNRSNEADGDSSFSQRGMSHITLMEVAG